MGTLETQILDPIWDFSTKKGFKIRDPRISWYPFGTKNHEMRGPPVFYSMQRFSANKKQKT